MKALAFLKDLIVIVLVTITLYAGIDITFGFFYPPRPYDSHPERLTSPAYANEPYFSEEFLIESFTQPGNWRTPEGTWLVFPNEFHGKFFNTDVLSMTGNVYRRTINSYGFDQATTRILLLGGSTLYNSEVPDDLTVGSWLSHVMNSRHRGKYFVLNAGVTSINSLQEVERLKDEISKGLTPDIVVVYDGVNDVYQGIYQGNPAGVIFSAHHRKTNQGEVERRRNIGGRVSLQTMVESWLLDVQLKLPSVAPTYIYEALKSKRLRDNQRVVPQHMEDRGALRLAAKKTKDAYVKNILAMQRLAEENHFTLVVCLQGHAFIDGYTAGSEDVELARDLASRQLPKIKDAFDMGYPLLRKAMDELRAEGVYSFDLSQIFLIKKGNVFVDFCHTNSIGNRLIAESLGMVLATIEGRAKPLTHEPASSRSFESFLPVRSSSL